MKKVISVLVISLPAYILSFCTESTSGKQSKINNIQSANIKSSIAVLELFTSQGCSSCPPADRLLGNYADAGNVIALSFHDDYWDRLGWKDPFSSAAFSQRQNAYAKVLGLSQIYTPQLIINGEKEMVGSAEDKIAATIKKAEEKQSAAIVTINKVSADDAKATLDYSIEGTEKNAILNIALVQNKITTNVKTGENGGATLTNYNVVRNFKSIASVNGTNSAFVDLPQGVDKKDLSVIIFLQSSSSYRISAAAKSSL